MADERSARLEQLAAAIRQAGLATPAAMALDVLAPIDIVSSQLALFARPLIGGTRYEPYAAVLTDAASWQELRRLLGRQ